ncbi:pyridoxal phosphate-dependent aminotransferase [Candidatus Methylacidithermus pantelleriae]|uniref:Aminotransferase n=1 Tax=Candidatus Methylacidithermus pantelleriae TaxID=2744239 RepID=A0A8J2BL19_9BACT|nr:pyridoxal phosphate-dependent aminotransferase [Candidatus Methylacidithermus pantelleriae]CAF0698157.1 Aspartate aminotransferase [Candidatus Methylacidithermus pantelleriae]
MELARRVRHLSPSLTLALDSKAKAMRAQGVDIVNFASGEPDFDTPEHIKAAAMGALDAGFTKYTPPGGIPELRRAISEKLKADNGLDYSPEQIVVTAGAKQACLNVLLAVVEPEDEVIIPSPYWVSYPEMVKLAGGEPVLVPTRRENGYKITPEEFADHMTPRTRLIILNSPHNPTGSLYSEKELQALAQLAAEEEILILSDEIYEKLVYDGRKAPSVAALGSLFYELCFTVNGFSKAYAMTGWRLGYVAAPRWAAEAIESIQSHTSSHATSFAQRGALAAYKGPQDCVAEMVAELDRRRQRMMQWLNKMDGLTYVPPHGAFYIFADITALGLDSRSFCEQLLEREHVVAVPGIVFGEDSSVRLSYATTLEEIDRGMERVARFVASLH